MGYELRETDADVVICDGVRAVGDVTLGRGVSIWYNAVLRGDDGGIVVGEDTNIQDCAVLHEGTVVGRGCTIGHGAVVHGCTVGDNTLIGMGAVILNGAKIGDNCIVGAGALVTGKLDAPDGSLILGSPAKVVRPLTEEEIGQNRAAARKYLHMAEQVRREQEQHRRDREAWNPMGMTDAQWKNDLRNQMEDWEEVQELIENGRQAEALEKIEKVKKRIREGIES